jgi:hypothetical protein
VRQSREAGIVSSKKKVIVRMNDQTLQAGYQPAPRLLNRSAGTIDLLDTTGRIVPIMLTSVRYVAYVRDFNLDDTQTPERLSRKSFLARPRTEGLWLRLTFHDGEVLEGLASLDLTLLEDAAADEGIYLIPPDVRSNTQRMFVPHLALAGMQILGVITTPSKALSDKKTKEDGPRLPFPE